MTAALKEAQRQMVASDLAELAGVAPNIRSRLTRSRYRARPVMTIFLPAIHSAACPVSDPGGGAFSFHLERVMILSEFKAWFEGFSELMEGAPNEKQWKRIQERVAEIDGVAVAYPVFVDRYVERVRRYWDMPAWGAIGYNAGATGGTRFTANSASAMKSAGQAVGSGASFNSHSAMLDLGRAEFSSVAA